MTVDWTQPVVCVSLLSFSSSSVFSLEKSLLIVWQFIVSSSYLFEHRSVIRIHSSFLPGRKSCQAYYTWRTAKATLKARVDLSVLSNISCEYMDCLSVTNPPCVLCVKRPKISSRLGKPFPTYVLKHSLLFISFGLQGLAQISPLFYYFLYSQCTHSSCCSESKRQCCIVVSSGETA